MKGNISLLAFAIFIYCSSCRINGSLRGLTSYYEKTKKESPNLISNPDPRLMICELKSDDVPKVYPINDVQLKECLKEKDVSLIYIWSPNCRSKSCSSLHAVQEKCDEENIELFVVAEYYDRSKMQINYELKRPVVGIDTEYYGTNKTSKYISKFISGLISNQSSQGRYLKFKGEAFQQAFSELDSVQ